MIQNIVLTFHRTSAVDNPWLAQVVYEESDPRYGTYNASQRYAAENPHAALDKALAQADALIRPSGSRRVQPNEGSDQPDAN